jgi:ABC-type ATPase with predicted acetyltransferase domain
MSQESLRSSTVIFVSQVLKRDSFNCRGRPVARLEPVTSLLEREQNGRLSRLIPERVVRPGRAPWFTTQPPRLFSIRLTATRAAQREAGAAERLAARVAGPVARGVGQVQLVVAH